MIVAVVPAAGLSLRMGRPKLLLDVNGEPLIGRVVAALRLGGADLVLVVTPVMGQDGADRIVEAARDAGALASPLPRPSPDMRATLEHGVSAVEKLASRPIEGVLIAPGDSVGMTSAIVAAVVARFRADPLRVVVPSRGEKTGHPLALPWGLVASLRTLPPDLGLNALVKGHPDLVRVPVDDPRFADDLDTPEDYSQLRESPG